MSDFSNPISFHIDNGELNDQSKVSAFVLGFEVAQCMELMYEGTTVGKPVHAANSDRLMRIAADMGATIKLDVYHDDWHWFTVITTAQRDAA